MKRTTVALYARVSTDDQTTANQLPELVQAAKARRLGPVTVYEENQSAVKHRPRFEAMLAAARRGDHPVIIVWALDRLGRNMVALASLVQDLDARGIRLVSLRETWLDTGDPLLRKLLVGIFGWLAEMERSRLLERQAIARKRMEREGRTWGRPPRCPPEQEEIIRAMAAEGRSVRAIAAAVKVPKSTVGRVLSRKPRSEEGPSAPSGEVPAPPSVPK